VQKNKSLNAYIQPIQGDTIMSKNQYGKLFHSEFRTSDPAATAAFMGDVFGWTVMDTPHPAYKIFETPGDFEGHIGPVDEPEAAPSTTNYILVEDIGTAEKAVEAAGGKLLAGRGEAEGQGLYTPFEAPGGLTMMLWQNVNGDD
jgi:predicted enzyme related to lactoylglutathione lyase